MHCDFYTEISQTSLGIHPNPKTVFVITSLTTTQIEYGLSLDEFSEDFLARFQDM
jgi:hypothetical protein